MELRTLRTAQRANFAAVASAVGLKERCEALLTLDPRTPRGSPPSPRRPLTAPPCRPARHPPSVWSQQPGGGGGGGGGGGDGGRQVRRARVPGGGGGVGSRGRGVVPRGARGQGRARCAPAEGGRGQREAPRSELHRRSQAAAATGGTSASRAAASCRRPSLQLVATLHDASLWHCSDSHGPGGDARVRGGGPSQGGDIDKDTPEEQKRMHGEKNPQEATGEASKGQLPRR